MLLILFVTNNSWKSEINICRKIYLLVFYPLNCSSVLTDPLAPSKMICDSCRLDFQQHIWLTNILQKTKLMSFMFDYVKHLHLFLMIKSRLGSPASTLQSVYFSSICLNIQKEVYTNRIYMYNVTLKSPQITITPGTDGRINLLMGGAD